MIFDPKLPMVRRSPLYGDPETREGKDPRHHQPGGEEVPILPDVLLPDHPLRPEEEPVHPGAAL